jgi:4-aminobutyrate aminotransferase
MTIKGTESTPLVRVPIPGPLARRIIARDHRHMVTTTKTAPVTVRVARGVVVEDVDGNRLLDFAAGIGVLNTGHCHPRVVKAVQDQAARVMHFAGTDFYYDIQATLAERLNRVVPTTGRSRKVFYTQSGTESNEAAIKVAKRATGRHRFLAFHGAFHGRTMGSLSLTASKYIQKQGFFPSMPGVTHAHFPNPFRNIWEIDGYAQPQELANRAIDHIEQLFEWSLPPENVAACFWEPVQGEGGYVVPPKMFPRMLRKLLDEHGILLVADEVQTGFGRTGKWFGSQHFDTKADIVTIAKAMGSGLPIGACVVRSDLDFPEKGCHSNTYGGNLVTCAASLATIDVIEQEGLVAKSARRGARLGDHLDELLDEFPHIGDHRGLGLMRAIEFTKPDGRTRDAALRDRVEKQAWKRGLITLGCGRSSLRIIPPLIVTEAQIDGAAAVLRAAVKAAAQ